MGWWIMDKCSADCYDLFQKALLLRKLKPSSDPVELFAAALYAPGCFSNGHFWMGDKEITSVKDLGWLLLTYT